MAQTLHNVAVSNNQFTPSDLTINVGDTVRWTNVGGGLHNVTADDGSFNSGAASTDPWVFDHVFTMVGSNPYYCSEHGGIGGAGMSGVITVQSATGVSDDNDIPNKYELMQNYPNPFNPTTIIQYSVPESGTIRLSVFNSIGEEVALLIDGFTEAGNHEVIFDSANLTSGFYFYKLQANNFTRVRKMILLK